LGAVRWLGAVTGAERDALDLSVPPSLTHPRRERVGGSGLDQRPRRRSVRRKLVAGVCLLFRKALVWLLLLRPYQIGEGEAFITWSDLGSRDDETRDALGTRFRVINPAFKAPRRRNGVRHTPWVGRSAGTRLVTFACWAVLRVNCYLWAACWSCAISGAGCSRLSRTSPICDEPRPTKRTSELRIRCATAPKFPPQSSSSIFRSRSTWLHHEEGFTILHVSLKCTWSHAVSVRSVKIT
jgi:hypothetical protein